MSIELAYCSWGLSGHDEEILERIATAGIRWIDIRADDFTQRTSLDRMHDLGLRASCLGAAFGMPPGAALDSTDPHTRLAAVGHVESAIGRAHQLGLQDVYVIPSKDGSAEALARFTQSLTRIADRAAELGVRIGIEHFPHTALPTVAATLTYLRGVGHGNLYLLLDIGHAQMSNEDVPTAIADAGPLLGYVHLDDNDGVGDQHLSLYDGKLTASSLRATFAALKEYGYSGRASLELHPQLPDPLDALNRSRDAALAAMAAG
jgi:sugar phosphate isomerase/epimerase